MSRQICENINIQDSILHRTAIKYEEMVPDYCKRIIEETIAKIPKISGNELRGLDVKITEGDFIGYGGYNGENKIINITLASNLYASVGSYEQRLRALVRHEAQHHVWCSRTPLQRGMWRYGIDMLIKKLGYAPTAYVQKFMNAENGKEEANTKIYPSGINTVTYGDFIEQNPDIIYNESHSEVGAYIHEGNIRAYDDIIDGKPVINHYVELYRNVFEDEKDL